MKPHRNHSYRAFCKTSNKLNFNSDWEQMSTFGLGDSGASSVSSFEESDWSGRAPLKEPSYLTHKNSIFIEKTKMH